MGATYKLKRKKADGTLEDVILQGVITDLGEQEDNALAESAIINLLKPTSVQTGGYLYTYHTTCRNDAVMAICCKREQSIKITYISSNDGTVKYSSYNIETEELQSECWRLMADRNPSFESVSIGEYDGEFQCDNQINAQGFYINLTNEFGNSYLSFNINDGVELVQYDGTSLVLNGGYFSEGDSDGNSLIITPSAITHNDNEYQFPNKSGTLAVTEDIPSVDNVSQYYTTTNSNYPLLFKALAGNTSTSSQLGSTRFANNIYVNPSTGTVYANDFVVGGQSIVGGGVITDLGYQNGHADAQTTILHLLAPSTVPTGKYFYTYYNDCGFDAVFVICNKDANGAIRGTQLTSEGQFRKFWVDENGEESSQCLQDLGSSGGPIKLTSTINNLPIYSTTIGAHFNVFCTIIEPQELMIGSNTITLDSARNYSATVEGLLCFQQSNGNYVWHIMVTIRDDSNTGSADTYRYVIETASSFSIAHSGYYSSSMCIFSGILYQ